MKSSEPEHFLEKNTLPTSSGTYYLWLSASARQTIMVGRLGKLDVKPGYYCYIGSAFGPGGIRARLGRHLSKAKSQRWHIDYLRHYLSPNAVGYCVEKRLEHQWAQMALANPALRIPLKGFGASYCQCDSHLFFATNNIVQFENSELLRLS